MRTLLVYICADEVHSKIFEDPTAEELAILKASNSLMVNCDEWPESQSMSKLAEGMTQITPTLLAGPFDQVIVTGFIS